MTLSVIGAGVGRTGTTSLKLALERLGFGPCHHMIEVIHHPETIPLWIDAAEGRPDWARLFDGYRSAVDWPEVAFWRELIELHPDAKVILTVRDPEAWFRSTQETILAPRERTGVRLMLAEMMDKVIGRFAPDLHDHDVMLAAFEAHNAEVRRVVPAERLLVYDAAEGWAPLCAFLGTPVPDAPMPHANTTESFRARYQRAPPT